MADSTKAKEASEAVDPFPSLSGNTVSIWYRVCLEQLQVGRAGGLHTRFGCVVRVERRL